MTNINFGSNIGTTIAFNPATDTLTFGAIPPFGVYYSASQLSFEQDGADLIVRNGSHWVRLASVSFGSLTSSDFVFASGDAVRFDTSGNDVLNGAGNDYFDIRKGGSDTVNAGGGTNKIYVGAALDNSDVIVGGSEFDFLVFSGNYATTLTLSATMVTGVEHFIAEAGSTVRLVLDAATISSAYEFYVNASAQLTGDLLYLDGSAATQVFDATGGGGNDTIIGGADFNYLQGGGGNDYLAGGTGDDQLLGQGGDDTLLGGDDADTLFGGDGADILYGGDGDDSVRGDTGDDLIYGGSGDDMLFGFTGNDTLDGGAGADVFVLANYGGGQGSDQINGFNVSEDTFWLQGLGAFTGASEAGGNTTLTYAYGTVQVNGVTGLTLGDWNDLRNYWYEYAPPEITSDGGGATAELGILEGETAVTTVTAFDPNPYDAPYFEIVGGDDAALFGIDNWTGELVFLAAPDFEAPADADYDNVYEVIVQAGDGVFSDSQAISVTVEDVAERGGFQSSSGFAGFGSSPGSWKFEGLERFALHHDNGFSLSPTDWLV